MLAIALEMYSCQPTMQVSIILYKIYYYYKGCADSLVCIRRVRDVLRYLTVLGEKVSEKVKSIFIWKRWFGDG